MGAGFDAGELREVRIRDDPRVADGTDEVGDLAGGSNSSLVVPSPMAGAFCLLPFSFCLSTQFHPAVERGFDAHWRLHVFQVRVLHVRFGLLAEFAEGLVVHGAMTLTAPPVSELERDQLEALRLSGHRIEAHVPAVRARILRVERIERS